MPKNRNLEKLISNVFTHRTEKGDTFEGLGIYDPVAGEWLQTPAESASARAEQEAIRAEKAVIARKEAEARAEKAEAEAAQLREALAHLQADRE